MTYDRNKVVQIMKNWVGLKESDGSHKAIIDIYNSISPLPRSYKVKYTDAWCAATVSAAYHKAGYDVIFPSECGCSNMIDKAKKMGIWQENDAYVPSPGDCILYDWQDSGVGDNTGTPDHVGIVEKVEGSNITVIEGNYSDSVKRRVIAVNGKYIRGYVCPKFDSSTSTTTNVTTKGVPNKTPQSIGKVTADLLNVRSGAGKTYANIKTYPQIAKNTVVEICDALTAKDNSTWYYIRINKKTYGFVSAKYISVIS